MKTFYLIWRLVFSTLVMVTIYLALFITFDKAVNDYPKVEQFLALLQGFALFTAWKIADVVYDLYKREMS